MKNIIKRVWRLEKVSSSYFYPGTNILINKAGLKDQELLNIFERNRSALRLMEMRMATIKGNFDLKHLANIHKYTFQDVYPFAGEIRTTNISKDGYWFADYSSLSFKANNLFQNLKETNYLIDLSKEQFALKAAQYYSDLNYLHPFREGNGRTIREFFRQLSGKAGYQLEWSQVSKEEYLKAVIQTNDAYKINDLTNVFLKCIKTEEQIQPNQQLNWTTPAREMMLKEVIKIADGMPLLNNDEFQLEAPMLKKPVERFCITRVKDYEKLDFSFKNSEEIHTLKLEKVPHLSKEVKSAWLDKAADFPRPIIQNNKGLELGS